MSVAILLCSMIMHMSSIGRLLSFPSCSTVKFMPTPAEGGGDQYPGETDMPPDTTSGTGILNELSKLLVGKLLELYFFSLI